MRISDWSSDVCSSDLSADQGWHPLPPDHIQDRHPVLAAQAVRTCCNGVCCCRPGVVWLDLLRKWSLHEHEHAAVECIDNCISDWIDRRADTEHHLSTIPRLLNRPETDPHVDTWPRARAQVINTRPA